MGRNKIPALPFLRQSLHQNMFFDDSCFLAGWEIPIFEALM
jgi:hypothetical protein